MEAENYEIRDLLPADHEIDFLTTIAYIAYYPSRYPIPDAATARHIPSISTWTANWGQRGDIALLAQQKGQFLGAAYSRLFSIQNQVPGFLNEQTPVLLLGVLPQYRRHGIARCLLNALIERAKAAGFPALSLAVSIHNPAILLYEYAGFRSAKIDEDMLVTMEKSLTSLDTTSAHHFSYYVRY